MKNTPLESAIVTRAIKELNALDGCLAKKFHGSPMGHPELDVYGCYKGRAFFIEGKRPGQRPTVRQESIIRKWEQTGAIVGWFTSAEEALAIVCGGHYSS